MIFLPDNEVQPYAAFQIKTEESGIVNEPMREAA